MRLLPLGAWAKGDGLTILISHGDRLPRTWQNDAMVNSLYVSPDGQFIITGDSKVRAQCNPRECAIHVAIN